MGKVQGNTFQETLVRPRRSNRLRGWNPLAKGVSAPSAWAILESF